MLAMAANYKRRVNATRQGIIKLLPRIRVLRKQLKPLDDAILHLYNVKYDAERHLIKVKKLPAIPTPTKRKRRKPATKSIADQIAEMTANERADLIAKLEAEI